MFRKFKEIDTAFRYIRTFSAVFVCACTVISIGALYGAHRVVAGGKEKVFVLANGKALEAFAEERKDNIAVEARDHVKMFHTWFFTLGPDEQVIQSNMAKALYLADGSAKRVYESLKENNYYTGLISGNVSQEITVDSIRLDTSVDPFYFRCFATQKITRPSSVTTRSLITEGRLRNVSRSDHNPHGFLVEKWNTIENKDVKTQGR